MSEEPREGIDTGELLKQAEQKRREAFNLLFGVHPSLNEPYREASRSLVHKVAETQLRALQAAGKLMTSGQRVVPEYQQQLAMGERAVAVIEGKRQNPKSLEQLISLWVREAQERADMSYRMMMANRPSRWQIWRKEERIQKGQKAEQGKKALYKRAKEVERFVKDNIDDWASGDEWKPAASE